MAIRTVTVRLKAVIVRGEPEARHCRRVLTQSVLITPSVEYTTDTNGSGTLACTGAKTRCG